MKCPACNSLMIVVEHEKIELLGTYFVSTKSSVILKQRNWYTAKERWN